jgi:hypothetical protein
MSPPPARTPGQLTGFVRANAWPLALAVILLSAILFRVAFWDFALDSWTRKGVPISDARALDLWAMNILDGIGFRARIGLHMYEAFRMPFFSIVLAAIYAVFGQDYLAARIVLVALSVGICLAVAGIGRLLVSRRAGFVAGLACAFYVPFVRFAAAFMTETLFIFLFATGIYLLLRSLHERDWGFAAASGVALGLGAMTRMTILAVMPALGLYLAAFPAPWRRKVRLGVFWVAAMVMSFSPWIVRNCAVFGTFFPSESGGTLMLWTGSHPEHGSGSYSRGWWYLSLWEDPSATELGRNQRMQKEATKNVVAEPGTYLRRMIWRGREHMRLPSLGRLLSDPGVEAVSTVLAFWLGLAGMVLAVFRRPRAGLFMAGVFGLLLVFHSVAGEPIRYRLTSETMWLLGVGCLADQAFLLWARWRRREVPPDPPVRSSIFDRPLYRWGVPAVLAAPFLALVIRIEVNRNYNEGHQLPPLPANLEEAIADCELSEAFAAQDGRLYDIEWCRRHVAEAYPNDVVYPRYVVVFSGELSYFELEPKTGRFIHCTLVVNKGGGYVGDAELFCLCRQGSRLIVPKGLRRTQGMVIGRFLGDDGLGAPRIEVADILLNHHSLLTGKTYD